jgi:hypothetical protein
MEEKVGIATAWAGWIATERDPLMYTRMHMLPWSNTFVSIRAGWDQFQLLFGEPASRVTKCN